jgi:hypothetical protein
MCPYLTKIFVPDGCDLRSSYNNVLDMRSTSCIENNGICSESRTALHTDPAKQNRSENRLILGQKTLGRLPEDQADDWFRQFLRAFREVQTPPVSAMVKLTPVNFSNHQADRRVISTMTPLFKLAGFNAPWRTWRVREQIRGSYGIAAEIDALGDSTDALLWRVWHRDISGMLEQLAAGARSVSIPAVKKTLERDDSGKVTDRAELEPVWVLNAQLERCLRVINWERIRRCKICRTIFLAAQLRSCTCSDTCNNRYRQRRWDGHVKTAARLASEGMSAIEIAKQLDVPYKRARAYMIRAKQRRKTISAA